jgi:hypothetical protein
LGEAIASVKAQSLEDWELIVVNDHSPQSLKPLASLFRDERLHGCNAKRQGTSHARNQGASMAKGKLLVALDHDDKLPAKSLEKMSEAWEPSRVVYGSTQVVTPNGSRVHRPPQYSFNLLLRALPLPVGSLHALSDWKLVGGWDPRMEKGLEDWEYWIHLGEVGVCGKAIPDIVYIYRRHSHSRLATLKQTPNAYTEAYQMMRMLHLDTYNGKRSASCCGGGGGKPQPSIMAAGRRQTSRVANLQVPHQSVQDGQLVPLRYTGGMKASTGIVGEVSGFRYSILGPGTLVEMPDGRKGVDPRDVNFFLRVNRGHDFQIGQ